MDYRQLGKSDLLISQVAFGCMSLKGTQAENEQLLHRAIDLGINIFDTADIYDKGTNEKTLGKAFINKRDKIIIATKVGNQVRADGSGLDWNPTKKHILSAVEGTLKRLQTDYIDLYQLHGGTIDDPIEETIDAFEMLKKAGKIRHYGISSIRPNVIKEYVRKSNIVSVMTQYNLLDRRAEETCLPLLSDHNIGVLARGTVAGGLLVNKTVKAYLNYSEKQVSDAAAAVRLLSGEKRSSAQTAISFVLQNTSITSAVVGIHTMDQLEDAVGVLASPKLSDLELEALRQVNKINYYDQHR